MNTFPVTGTRKPLALQVASPAKWRLAGHCTSLRFLFARPQVARTASKVETRHARSPEPEPSNGRKLHAWTITIYNPAQET
jgi:hypothetical protein